MFAWLRGLLRQEVDRNVPHQAETDEEIDALCEPLIASEGRQDHENGAPTHLPELR
jgi:hypothetical protein